MATSIQNLPTLKINYLSQSDYNTALQNGQINSDELYFTPEDSGRVIVSNQDASTPEAYPENSI